MRPMWGSKLWVLKTSTGGTEMVHTGASCHLEFSKRYGKSLKAVRTSAEVLNLCGRVPDVVMVLLVYV